MLNDIVHSLSWSNITLTVEDRSTKKSKNLVSNVSGRVKAGKHLAASHMFGSMANVESR
jgi:hypothetical protein